MIRRRSSEKSAVGAAALCFAGALGSACSTPPAQLPTPAPVAPPRAPIAPLSLPVGGATPEAVLPQRTPPAPRRCLLPAVDFYGHAKVLGWNGLEIDLRGASERASQLVDCSPAGLDDHDDFWMAGPGGLHRAHPLISPALVRSLPLDNDSRGHTVVSGRMVAVFDGATVAISHMG